VPSPEVDELDYDDAPDYERDPFEDCEPDTDTYEERRAEEAWAAMSPLARMRARLESWWYWRQRRRHPERFASYDTEAPF
jgi:hypothetical protein